MEKRSVVLWTASTLLCWFIGHNMAVERWRQHEFDLQCDGSLGGPWMRSIDEVELRGSWCGLCGCRGVCNGVTSSLFAMAPASLGVVAGGCGPTSEGVWGSW